jgi:hypothetical protein
VHDLSTFYLRCGSGLLSGTAAGRSLILSRALRAARKSTFMMNPWDGRGTNS